MASNLPVLNRLRRQLLVSSFSPASLFASSEPGVWYDPSDLTTMFQDSAGMSPVTATGQTVALLLDKSRGLALGNEQIVNGTFTTDSDWAKINGATISGGVANLFNAATNPAITQTRNFALGRTYFVSLTWTGTISAGMGAYGSGDNRFITNSSAGSWTGYVTLSAGTGALFWVQAPTNVAATVDNITVKELAGNHATQATSGSRPTYGIEPFGGRRNLLVRTEEFENAVWTKVNGQTVSPNTTIAPDGSMTADSFLESAPNNNGGSRNLYQAVAMVASTNYTFSCSVKSNGRDFCSIGFNTPTYTAGAGFTFQFSTATISSPSTYGSGVTLVSYSATDQGNGWYRLTVTASSSSNTTMWFQLNVSALVNFNTSYVGNTSLGMFLWGAQLETGTTATAYQRVTDQWNVTQAGVASVSYLAFDGTDDFLLTGTITPGIDKAQVFAGVRKLSDAVNQVVVETSANIVTNNGVFSLQAPQGATAPYNDYGFASKGTLFGLASTGTSGYDAPITNVLTGIGDIAGDAATLRINGTQAAQNTDDQGTGNYLAYPLYIGRRAGTTVPLNGRIYSLIVRFGANLAAGTITQTETWVNGKTGAYSLSASQFSVSQADNTMFFPSTAVSDASGVAYTVPKTGRAADGTSYNVI